MKQRTADSIKTALCLLAIVLLTNMSGALPWWSFVVPVIVLGLLVARAGWEVNSFAIGFLTGFVIWLGANLYFTLGGGAGVLTRIAHSVNLHVVVVLLVSCLIGGLLTGLALYAGKMMVPPKRENAY